MVPPGLTTVPNTVCDLISQQARDHPDHIAISYNGISLSYINLDLTSSRIALVLRQRGIGPQDIVPVLTTRCLEMVASILAVLKIGACYVPIDIETWSIDRIETTLSLVAAKTIIVTGSSRINYHNAVTKEDIQAAFSSDESFTSDPRVAASSMQPEDLAYIIFTSGTTAVPKGVMIPHKALLNYVQQGGDETPFNMNVTAQDRVLLIFSIAFDACTGVIFSTLCNGGTLVVSESSGFTRDVKNCSILPATPSILNTLHEPSSYDNIRAIYLGGESPTRNLIQQWQSARRKIFNCYGPTETTCASMVAKLSPDLPITLGRPMANSQIYLLDSRMKASTEGEICISGMGLAVGYFQNDELTKQRFIEWNGTRIYRTGDFGRQTPHGLEFMGRQDSLVKNRGFLINLESQVIPALRDHPGVQSATAFIHRDRLMAFISPIGLDVRAMRDQFSFQYDIFLVPDQIRTVDALPLSPTGKVDIHLLRDMLDNELAAIGNSKSNDGNSKMNILKSALSDTLGLPLQDIQSKSTFWELGGNSLSAVKLVAHLHQQHLAISFAQLFKLNSVDEICTAIKCIRPLPRTEASAEGILQTVGEPPSIAITVAPMTSVQMNMIRSSLHNPTTNYMLIAMTFEHGRRQLDRERLRNAWQTVLNRHSIFRTSFDLEKGLQQVMPDLSFDWDEKSIGFEDWEATVHKESQTMYDRVEGQSQETLYRPSNSFRLITVTNQKSTLLWLVHHSQVDGWSMSVLFGELQALLDGKRLFGAPQFSDFARAQQLHVGRVHDVDKQFWAQAMDGYLPVVPLRLPKPEPGLMAGLPSEQSIDLSLSPSQLERRARILGVSPAVIIYGAWAVLLSAYTSTGRVVFGTVFSGRNFPMPAADRIVGPLINTCPFFANIGATSNKLQALLDVEKSLLKINDHQWSSAQVLGDLSTRNQADLFNTVVAMEYDIPEICLNSETMPTLLRLSRKDVPEFGLNILIENGYDGLRARFVYDNSIYEASIMGRMLKHFRNVVLAFLDPRCLTIENVRDRMIDPAEFLSLTQTSPVFNEVYNGPANLKNAFEQAADQWPDLVAVESSTRSMTYRELDQISNRAANRLAATIQHGHVIGVLSDGSLDWIVAFLSVIKAGAIYTPIDITLPRRRMQVIAEHCSVVLCMLPGHRCQETFQVGNLLTLSLHDSLDSISGGAERLPTTAGKSDPAYLIFTSGSTGVPKGVRISHEAILSYISYSPARLHARPGRRNAQMYSVGFDASIAEIVGTICYGATLVLKDPEDPLAHLHRVHATMVTPSLLGICSPEDFKNLDTIFLGGEAVSQHLADSWSQGRRLYNVYGPCECAVGCLFAHLRPGEKVTLGYPTPRMAVYLLDAQKRPVPIGVPGDICLSGIQVGEGYVGLEAETRDRFFPDPYLPGRRMYRTGDLGIWTERMEVRFLGRVDNQVKVRGFRIELEEVEWAILEASPRVTHAVVVVQGDNLVGYLSPESVDTALIRKKIRSLLPRYACPSVIVALPNLPTTANQKIDKNALIQQTSTDLTNGSKAYTRTEKMLAQVWREIIGFESNAEFDLHDDFMFVGGNSLRQLKVAQKVFEKMGHKIPLGIIIRNTVLSSLAQAIDEYTSNHQSTHRLSKPFLSSERIPRASAMKLSILEEEMYLLHSVSNTRSTFNTICHLELHGNLDLDCLSQAINEVIAANEILRTRYVSLEGILYRKISQEVCPIGYFDASAIGFDCLEPEINKTFDLGKDQLIKAIIMTNTSSTSLIFVVHHIITDDVSMAFMLQEFQHKYTELLDARVGKARDVDNAAVPRLDYVDWAHWTGQRAAKMIEPGRLHFWREYCRDVPRRPFSHHGGFDGRDDGAARSFPILSLQTLSGSRDIHMFVAAVALTLQAVMGLDDMMLAIPHMDRYEPGTADLLGLFLDRLPIRIQLSATTLSSADALLGSVHSAVQEALSNYIPYHEIRKAAGNSALFDVVVSHHRREDSLENYFRLPNVSVVRHAARAKGAKFPLMFEFSETESGTLCEIEYNTNLLDRSVIDAVQSDLPVVLEGLSQGRTPDAFLPDLTTQIERPTTWSRADAPAVSTNKTKIDMVRSVFAEVLGVDVESISSERSFFDLGGSSVLSLRVQWLLRQRQVQISLREISGGRSAERIAAAI
ncbi:MAG: hypothetical protein M1830_000725 [Pleopsidium flavum]|nr:MAG: hypothetical protein M1830_000725 [Pleopsidium flavum]